MAFVIKVNGNTHSVDADGDTPLLWVLRDVLGMTGTKFGCGIALCGACTVHLDGAALAYRLALLGKAPRAKAVLALAAERAGWGQPLPERVGRGVSLQFVFATYMAQVAEVEVSNDGAVRVRRVICAVDCGTVVNPDTVRAQVQSAIIFGITAALHGEITLNNGRVEQSNFDNYHMLRLNEAPAIEVHIIQNSEPPGGMGEAGTSAIVPAITNAILAATGKRLRKMPIDATALKQPA